MSATQNDRLLAYLDPDSMTIVTRDSLAAALVFLAPRDAPDAIRMNEETIVRHAIPRIEAEAVRNILTTMRDDLRLLDPDGLPVPIGRVRRKWWRLGMLSGWAVAADIIDQALEATDD